MFKICLFNPNRPCFNNRLYITKYNSVAKIQKAAIVYSRENSFNLHQFVSGAQHITYTCTHIYKFPPAALLHTHTHIHTHTQTHTYTHTLSLSLSLSLSLLLRYSLLFLSHIIFFTFYHTHQPLQVVLLAQGHLDYALPPSQSLTALWRSSRLHPLSAQCWCMLFGQH